MSRAVGREWGDTALTVDESRSTSQPGSYTISKVKKGGAPVHQRVEHRDDGYHVGPRAYPSLELLLQGEYDALGLQKACGGSKYRAIFETLNESGGYARACVHLCEVCVRC